MYSYHLLEEDGIGGLHINHRTFWYIQTFAPALFRASLRGLFINLDYALPS